MLGFISHPACHDHDAGPMHPDTPDRLDAIGNQLIMSGLDFVLRHYDAPLATREQLLRAHDRAYLDRIFASAPTDGSVEIDGDTVMSPGTLAAALHAAGAGVLGVDLIMRAEANPVFCAVRPPGHHATHDTAMGFCLFNNIAVAAAHALAEYGFSRIAILDFDVHHGNGTEEIFHSDDRVLFCSTFQHPFYPFTGHESDATNLVDVPLPAGTDGAAFRAAVAEHWLPALDRFRPEFLFISAGFDAHLLDDMSSLALTEDDYRWLTRELVALANTHSSGRILSMLEGGYEPGALARSVVAHINALMG
ncbi:histone deacetylase family protein [Roseovarius amoyensis]|uniref:histone deacetylase family protein n=1 Tax=Roseovarius amoyensis TaxID=2211448 RepID=UPI000DBE0245|nr:histone deacetylase family protein [Roseovarius amoyensis]